MTNERKPLPAPTCGLPDCRIHRFSNLVLDAALPFAFSRIVKDDYSLDEYVELERIINGMV